MPDATPAWVWVENLPEPGQRIVLPREESRYVARVCRARAGETLALTDGRGGVARALIESLDPQVAAVIEQRERSVPARSATLLCGAPERPRFDWLVEKLAELGVTTVRPIHCDRARWERGALRAERWGRLARAALQQSRGRFLLQVEAPASLEEALSAEPEAALGVLADPSGESVGGLSAPEVGRTVGIVGPAAGLTDAEKSSIVERGFRSITLSDSRLRTETAAIAWAAWWGAPVKPQDAANHRGARLDGGEGQP